MDTKAGDLTEVDVHIESCIIDANLVRIEVEDRHISGRTAYLAYRGVIRRRALHVVHNNSILSRLVEDIESLLRPNAKYP
jgi:hypothetical protein